MPFTPSQEAAAEVLPAPQDTCVVAGPGSGKTSVLIERYRRLVASGVSPLRILAITFTEKATNEMRVRLLEAFAGQADTLRAIERAQVSTVHGLCARLLREHALLAGVDPAFQVIAEQDLQPLLEDVLQSTLDAFWTAHPQRTETLLEGIATTAVPAELLSIYDAVRAAGLPLENLRQAVDDGCGPGWTAVLAALDAVPNAPGSGWTAGQREAWSRIAAWAVRTRNLGAPGEEHFALEGGPPGSLARVPAALKETVRLLRNDLLPRFLSALAARHYRDERETLFDLLVSFDDAYRRRKRTAGLLDFSDLEECAVRLLREHGTVREAVRARFQHILMDEFQDTNGVQAALVGLLRSPGRFYAVGDVNQSIYGFRHADPEVFRAYRETVRATGQRLVELRENWRSRSDVLAATSTILEGAAGIEPHDLIPARRFAPSAEPCVEVTVARAAAETALGWEAAWVARRARALAGCLMLESGPARYSGMAILLRSTAAMPVFAAACEREGVPFSMTAGRGFFDAPEVADLFHLLRVLANPRDEISLAAVLRSPLVGASDAALLRLRARGPLAEALGEETGDPVLVQFAGRLCEWRERVRWTPPDRILAEAMDDAGCETGFTARARANAVKFLVTVREAAQRLPLDAIVDRLDRLRSSDPREPDSQAEDGGDFVRIQTIHSAKGLEFPVVFLPALHLGVEGGSGAIAFAPQIGLGVRWRNPASDKAVADPLREAIAAREKLREAAESNRLLYVAMTRARERLILSYSRTDKGARNWAKLVEERLLLPGDGARVLTVAPPAGPAFPVMFQALAQPPEPAPAALPAPTQGAPHASRIDPPAVRGYSEAAAAVTDVALFAHCPRRYWIERYLDPAGVFPAGDAPGWSDTGGAAGLGRRVHALLAGEAVDASEEEQTLARRFEESLLGRRAASTLLAYREWSFMFAVEEIVIRGQIDLWFEEGGEIVLVDYKSGGEENLDRAAVQVQLYSLALQRHLGRPPDAAWLFHLPSGGAIPVTPDRDAAIRAVRALCHAQERQAFPLREGPHCQKCPHFRTECPAGRG
ncbi:MAG: UvrD-helicase domain-containing protein [Bryobacterales bacterium]|nr:UvrD-helicase domain-containing protein [Bryobacterales bacterium]